jgi:group I intron endonuclease
MYIYTITNLINGHQYVGQTIRSPDIRWKEHKNASKFTERGFHIHRAMNKYGIENFELNIVDVCESLELLNEFETKWIEKLDTFHNGYNMTTGGGSTVCCDETKMKMSQSHSGENNSMYGKTHSTESKIKMSVALSGINHPMYGKCFSDNHKNSISTSLSGRKLSEEHKKKLGKSRLGKTHTIEAKRKISEAGNKKVSQYDLENNLIKTYDSAKIASTETGINYSSICNVRSGREKTAGGFIWMYT